MADIKYSQLGAATTITDTDVLPMVNMSADPIETNKITAAKVKEYVIGNTDISGIGNGTATGAISALKNGKTEGTAISEHVETIGSTAVGDYAIGETFLANNGNYYEATAAITGGSTTLTVGTNCKLSTVDEQLNSLKEALSKQKPLKKTVTLSAGTTAQTFSNQTGVTSDMEVTSYEIATPSAVVSDLSINTSTNSFTVQGTITASTNITLRFEEVRTS